ncbi:glycosyltransferase family 2 protein [Paraclostridium dentum]|uniref:glycosyltransferase family 2 protein n=1 Tax=Paraclostridium dentum TaxID=2662455 RepID=UPI003F3FD8EC
MKTSIVILSYNNCELTKNCIESIRKYTNKESYELIIIDNNSKDESVEYLKSQDDLICIFNEENKGFAGGCNQGIDASSGDNILLLNNDIIVTPNWLDNMVKALYSSDDIGAVGPVTNFSSNFQQVFVPVNHTMDTDDFFKEYNQSDTSKWEERLRLIGFCMLIKKEVVNKIGVLDELFNMGNYEDDDYSLRIRKSGYRLLLCKDTFIFHLGSASFSKLEEDRFRKLLESNRQKFNDKWNMDPHMFMQIRKDLTGIVKEFNKSDIKLLYIGCGSCSNLLDMKNELPDSKLYGIEPNENLVINVSHFADIKIGNEQRVDEYEKDFFDYVIIDYVALNAYSVNLSILEILIQHTNENANIFMILPNIFNSQVRLIAKLVKEKISPKYKTIIAQTFPSELQIEISK